MRRLLPFLILPLVLAACSSAAPGDGATSSSGAALSSAMNASSFAVSSAQPDVQLAVPQPMATITSPLTLSGSARGSWYFEASFPVELRDAQNTMIAQGHAQAQGNWMTTNFVPFTASLAYPPQPAGSNGVIVLRKDNPSGEPQNDASVTVPVLF